MFKKAKQLLVVATALLLCSCEGETTYDFSVANNTTKPLTVTMYYKLDGAISDTKSHDIPAGDTKQLLITSTLGGSPYASSINNWTDSVTIATADSGKVVAKGIMLESNWAANIREKKKVPSHYEHVYTFTVSQSDIK